MGISRYPACVAMFTLGFALWGGQEAIAQEEATENGIATEAAESTDEIEYIEEEAPVSDWTTLDARKTNLKNFPAASRISGEVGSAIVGVLPSFAVGYLLSKISDDGGLFDHYPGDAPILNRITTTQRALIIGAILTPAIESAAVHLVGSKLGNQGEAWTAYAGGATGGAIGMGLGALAFLKSRELGTTMMFVGSAVGALVGAVTWYEISHKEAIGNSDIDMYPIFSVDDQGTVLGMGMTF